MADSIERIDLPELFFGFVAPIGADLTPTVDAFRSFFKSQGYRVIEIKVTGVFGILEKYVRPKRTLIHKTPLKDRYETYIAYGNQLREKFGDSILATTTIRRVLAKRLKLPQESEEFSRTVFLIHQFKRREEIDLLRTVYGRLFFQVSVYSRRGARVEYLSRKFASSEHSATARNYRNAAEWLIQDDENEIDNIHGQRVGKVFHDADLIINSDTVEHVDVQVSRFIRLSCRFYAG
jgi:hypothetical protein